MAKRVCSRPGCPVLVEASADNRCAACRVAAERARGTASSRGYGSTHRRMFRAAVLAGGVCVLCGDAATVADHYPLSRRDLVAQGLNPDDPQHGRALCGACHGRETARYQPGGFRS